jgi:thiol-disulfide isomerase/thioredoxin
MRAAKFLCFAWLCSAAILPRAMAEVSGQERAESAGRAILGTSAPRVVLKTIDGEAIDLDGLYGKKAVYLKFWATWCVPCREQMPHFEHVYETAGPDMAVIAVDVGFNDSVDAVRAYRKKLGITMPIVFDDGSLGTAFHLRVTPTHVVIGRDGRVRYVGHLADKDLDAALISARAAPPAPIGRDPHAAGTTNDPPPIAIGDLLPKKTLRTIDGRSFTLRPAGAQRRSTVLVFLSPWCESYLATTRPEVSASCRSVRAQSTALAADPRVRWLGIASGLWANSDDLRQYQSKSGINIPLTLDASGEVFRTFRVNDVPTVLVADFKGRIVRRIDGSSGLDPNALRAAVDGL